MIGSAGPNGFLPFSGPETVAHRARVSVPESEEAIRVLESPDPYSEFKTYEGRRIERTERFGWRLLNHEAYLPEATGRPHIPVRIRRAVYERDGYQCGFCSSPDRLSLDHIVPFSFGGLDTEENLRVLCLPCNIKRGNRE